MSDAILETLTQAVARLRSEVVQLEADALQAAEELNAMLQSLSANSDPPQPVRGNSPDAPPPGSELDDEFERLFTDGEAEASAGASLLDQATPMTLSTQPDNDAMTQPPADQVDDGALWRAVLAGADDNPFVI